MENFVKVKIKNTLIVGMFLGMILLSIWACQKNRKEDILVEIYQLYEFNLENYTNYSDPYRDVEVQIELIDPDGEKLLHYGFYDGNNKWKIRFSPDKIGEWKYQTFFSDASEKISGTFKCVSTVRPGRVMMNESNPFWLGKGGEEKTLFRSLHVGDRFFATNWDNPSDNSDGNRRTKFLDWLQENKYNMLSVASHYTNRNQEGRGRGWDTPLLWPLDYKEYRKMETILNDLKERDITVFPFADSLESAAIGL